MPYSIPRSSQLNITSRLNSVSQWKFNKIVCSSICTTMLSLSALVAAVSTVSTPVMAKSTHDLSYKGYMRIGAGFSESGDAQASFRAPGAGSNYRLGNENNTFLRVGVDYKHSMPETANEGAYIHGRLLAVDFAAMEDSFSIGLDGIREASLRFNKFFDSDVVFSIGRMEYQRKGVHMTDYWWLNTSQGAHAGATVENLDVGGPGKLNLAFFRYEDARYDTTLNSSGLDARYQGVPVGENSKLSFWGFYGIRHGEDSAVNMSIGGSTTAVDVGTENGIGLGGWVETKVGKTFNSASLTYKSGPAITRHDGNATPVSEQDGFDLGESSAVEFINHMLIDITERYSVHWMVLARMLDNGAVANSDTDWISIGARSIFYFSEHVNLAFELGIDEVDSEPLGVDGNLVKSTLALQLAKGRGYYSRPVLRAFLTNAKWSSDFRGLVAGGTPYGDETEGWSVGTQLEAWW